MEFETVDPDRPSAEIESFKRNRSADRLPGRLRRRRLVLVGEYPERTERLHHDRGLAVIHDVVHEGEAPRDPVPQGVRGQHVSGPGLEKLKILSAHRRRTPVHAYADKTRVALGEGKPGSRGRETEDLPKTLPPLHPGQSPDGLVDLGDELLGRVDQVVALQLLDRLGKSVLHLRKVLL